MKGMEKASFVMAGGGTGGHVTPLVAVARELRKRGHNVTFIGTRQGIEARLVPQAGFPIEWIEIGGLNRVGLLQTIRTLSQLPAGIVRCARLLTRAGANTVFSLGGFAAGPVAIAAVLKRIPLVVMEPNAMPGFTNRALARFVYRALLGLPGGRQYFPQGKTEITGVPIREEFFHLPPPPDAPLTVLITGGSQGARTLNRAFRESWPLFAKAGIPLRFIHQSGPDIPAGFAASGLDGEVVPFIANMPEAFAKAHLIVGRSGASAVAEIAAAGKASILVPFPYAAGGHQLKNAEAAVRAGAAILVPDNEMNGGRLFREISLLTASPGLLQSMSRTAKTLSRPAAAARAADILEEAAS
jgi:UDP-N-acetylglucosamine--N-acetylmuramyl-(pentapeptide) pyrophosphoryl-undecaprenol N-acetylglucosamine transferase